MKRVLIIKMSSMGDVIHTLPALTDAQASLGDIQFDWVIEPGFAEVPQWHPAVNQIYTIPLREWRKKPWQTFKEGEWKKFFQTLRQTHYDAVIDAQGLVKSALITRFAKGERFGPNYHCAREPLASLAYHKPLKVAKVSEQHAVQRMRHLFASALKYPLPQSTPDYGIDKSRLAMLPSTIELNNSLLFLHGTTWSTKHWPQAYWQALGVLASRAGYHVLLPWGNETEYRRAESIRDFAKEKGLSLLPQVLPKLSLSEITSLLAKAKGAIAVDTGLGHIAAAMATPTVSIYGPTDPRLTGAHGASQVHLSAHFPCAPCFSRKCRKGENAVVQPPCFEAVPPESVWKAFTQLITQAV